jgi:Flp pilus assembly pilin Flp
VVEYALVLALVAVTCAGALAYLGQAVNTTLSQVAVQIAGGCAGGGGFQILVDGATCVADPWSLTAELGQGTTFQLTTVGGSAPVTYSCAGAGCDQFDLNSNDGSLQVLPAAPDGALPPTRVVATDSAKHVATADLAVVVGPTSLVAGLPLPASAQCTSSAGPPSRAYLQCANGAWLDGYYIYTTGGWQLVTPGQGLPRWEVSDSTALLDGTYEFGSTGAPAGPWTCDQLAPDGACAAMSTNAAVGSVSRASPGALGIAG